MRYNVNLARILLIGCLLLAGLLFVPSPIPEAERILGEVWNIGHLFFFCLLSISLIQANILPCKGAVEGLVVFAANVLLATVVEILQANIEGRDASLHDWQLSILGSSLGVLLALDIARQTKWLLFSVCLLCSLWLLRHPALVLLDEWERRQQWPLLADFETQRELSRWTGTANFIRERDQKRSGEYSLKVTTIAAKYSGVWLNEAAGNWMSYDYLAFSIYVEQPTSLKVRIHDKAHNKDQRYEDRFNRQFDLHSGWQRIRIPLEDILNAPSDRRMDGNEIASVGWYVVLPPDGLKWWLDDIHLE